MRKPIPILTALFSIVFIVLSAALPLNNSSYTFLSSAEGYDASKPVVFHFDSFSRNFIDSLSAYSYAAHRGAPLISAEPENSMPAFKASKKLGFKVMETDLQLTKDGQWVIMHDYSLDRTSTGTGSVKNRPLKYIKKLSLKSSKAEVLSIPVLEDFLGFCSSEGVIPILDIKPTEKEIPIKSYNSLFINLNKYNLLDKSILTSHSKEVLKELRRHSNVTAIAAMLEVNEENIEFTKSLDNAFIYTNYEQLSEESIHLINKNNVKFGVWTVNDEHVAKLFLEKGALIVVTDNLFK